MSGPGIPATGGSLPRLSAEQQAECLAYNPFEGDFGEPGDKIFADRMCVSRSEGQCHNCAGPIAIGEHQRRHDAKYGGEMRSYRWCRLCCESFALSWTDGGDAMCARFALRSEAA